MIPLTDIGRYASPEMVSVLSHDSLLACQRTIWVEVMKAQAAHSSELIAPEDVEVYEALHTRLLAGLKAKMQGQSTREEWVDATFYGDYLRKIKDTEQRTRHDLKAHLEVFDALAGGRGKLHLGLTSSDVTENATHGIMFSAFDLFRFRERAVLSSLDTWIDRTFDLAIVGRTHNVPAQPILLASRFARCASQMLRGNTINFRTRGFMGAVGNAADAVEIFGVDMVRAQFEAGDQADTWLTGQTSPRFQDLELIQYLDSSTAPIADLCATLRLMAGNELCWEGQTPGQVGSSAMPHKRNMRYTERIHGLRAVLKGYRTMIDNLGPTWNEGDVSDSVTRRVALPGAMLAADAIMRNFQYLLSILQVDEQAHEIELVAYQMPMATGRILAQLVQLGIPRERGHEVLREAIEKHGADRFGVAALVSQQCPVLDQGAILQIIQDDRQVGLARDQIEQVRYELAASGSVGTAWDVGQLL